MTAEPKLRPPGAGLPPVERLVAKYLVVPWTLRELDWPTAAARFQAEGAAVLALFDATPAGQQTRPVLIRRLQGLEDSSRYWSAAMTVEHLVIVGTGIRKLIDGLRAGVAPDRPTRVEDVKPTGLVPPAEVRARFAALLAEAAADGRPPVPRGAGPKHAHPWFGPFDAAQWHAMNAVHQGIHRKQLGSIRAGLSAA